MPISSSFLLSLFYFLSFCIISLFPLFLFPVISVFLFISFCLTSLLLSFYFFHISVFLSIFQSISFCSTSFFLIFHLIVFCFLFVRCSTALILLKKIPNFLVFFKSIFISFHGKLSFVHYNIHFFWKKSLNDFKENSSFSAIM